MANMLFEYLRVHVFNAPAAILSAMRLYIQTFSTYKQVTVTHIDI